MSDNAVAALAVVCIFGAPVAAFIVIRVLAHRERIELIRRGMIPPGAKYRAMRQQSEMGMPPGTAPVWSGGSDDDSPDGSLRKGIRLTLIGLAILIGLSFIGYDRSGPLNSMEIHPGPWLLGGLIPMFVGIAQIIIALLSGAQLGLAASRWRPGAPPYNDRPDVREPYVYEAEPRTHSGFDELKRPTGRPPEKR